MSKEAVVAAAFGITEAEVTAEHMKMASKLVEDLREPEQPKFDLGKSQLDELQKRVQEMELENEKARRELAEYKSRPASDPDEARKDFEQVAKIKTLPDIQTAVMDDAEGEADVRAFRKQWDILHTLSTVLGSERAGRVPVQRLGYWQKLQAIAPEFAKAVDTATASGGAEWAPSLYSSDLQDYVYNATGVARLFPRTRSPRHSWVMPFTPDGGTVYLAGEATSDSASDYTSTTPGSGNVTVTAKKLVCRIPWSDEFDEDSVVAAASLFQQHSIRLMAEALDSAIVNGDTTSPHQDTGKSYTSTSAEAAWDGLRDVAMNGQSNSTDLSTFTGDAILALIAGFDTEFLQNPADIVVLVPAKIRHKLFTLIDNSTNKIPVYSHNTPMHDDLVRTGAIMDFYGSGVYSTAALWSDMNASGIYDNSTKTKSSIVVAYKPGFLLTDRKDMSLSIVDQPLKGLRNSLLQWRGSFDDRLATTRNYVAVGYNITTA
jgi:HK97 family phage major capsid protein